MFSIIILPPSGFVGSQVTRLFPVEGLPGVSTTCRNVSFHSLDDHRFGITADTVARNSAITFFSSSLLNLLVHLLLLLV